MKTSIYLPDDLATQAHEHNISISEIAQDAIRKAVTTARTNGKTIELLQMLLQAIAIESNKTGMPENVNLEVLARVVQTWIDLARPQSPNPQIFVLDGSL